MSLGVGGWKTRITSTMRSNNRMNAMLNESSVNLASLMTGKKKNLAKLKEAIAASGGGGGGGGVGIPAGSVVGSTDGRESCATVADIPKPNMDEIYRILEETICRQLNGEKFFQTYNSQISAKFCQILVREIRNKVKLLNHERYSTYI